MASLRRQRKTRRPPLPLTDLLCGGERCDVNTKTALKPCPLCGRESHAIQPIRGRGHAWNVACGSGNDRDDPAEANGCGLVLFGDEGRSRNDMVEQWNMRTM